MKRSLGAFFIFFVVLASVQIEGIAHAIRDYRSNAAAFNWDVRTSWQRWNGAAWVTPTSGLWYPSMSVGALTLTIQNGHNVTLDVSPVNSISNLLVGGASGSSNFFGVIENV